MPALIAASALLTTVLTSPIALASTERTPARATEEAVGIASALSRAQSSGQPVVATAATDSVSQTIANPNGTLTKTTSLRPVRTKRDGKWVNLDATLSRNADGTYRPNATAASVTLSGGGPGPVATIANRGQSLAFTFPVTLTAPAVVGNTATYPEVLPGVDLVASVSEQGDFAHTLVVKTRAAATNPEVARLRVSIDSPGLTLTSSPDGRLTAADATGHAVYTTPPATMWDSAKEQPNTKTPAKASTAAEPGNAARVAPVSVVARADGYDLVPDAALLADPATVYPVMIDPTFVPNSWGATADWTEVESGKSTYAGWHQSGPAQVGYCGFGSSTCKGIDVTRSYFQWGITALYGATILSAEVNFVPQYSYNCNSQVALDWTGAISPSTTWNTKPATLSTVAQKGTFGNGVTAQVQSAVTNRTGVTTFGLRAVDEGTIAGWKKFTQNNASLVVTWDVTPATPVTPSTSPVVYCTTTAPYPVIGKTDLYLGVQTLRASDNVTKALTATFSIKPATDPTPDPATGGTQRQVNINTGDWATVVLTQNTLPQGDYRWTTRVTDGALTSAWSPECRFTLDLSVPAQPLVNSTDYPNGTTGKPIRTAGSFTFTPVAGSTQPAWYRYQLNGGTGMNVPATGGSWTGTITPTRAGTNTLTVQAITAAGTPSPTAVHHIIAAAPANPDKEGDLNGDGNADVLTVGGTGGTAAGLWLSPGNGAGSVGVPTNIGIRGRLDMTESPDNWTGMVVASGQFGGTGLQDVIATAPNGITKVYLNAGDGTPLDPSTDRVFSLGGDRFVDPDFTELMTAPSQLTAIGHLPQGSDQSGGSAFPDLIAVVAVGGQHQLWWFEHSPYPGGYQPAVVLDSSTDWSTKTIAGTRHQGKPALVVRDNATGQVVLHRTNCVTECWDTNWFVDSSTTVARSASAALTAASAPVILSNDATNDTNTDLWAITGAGAASFGAGSGAHTFAAPSAAGSVLPPASANLRSFGAIRWRNPTTGLDQTDIYANTPTGQLLLFQPQQSGVLGAPKQVGNAGWQGVVPFGVADWDHDGYPDLIARDDSNCAERVYRGSPTGFALPVQIGVGWCGYTPYGVTDWNRDGHFDVIATNSSGALLVYPGDLTGGVAPSIQIGNGWSADLTPWGIVDFNGDGHQDIVTRYIPTNTLRMYPGDNTGTGDGAGATVGAGFNGTAFFGFARWPGDTTTSLLSRFSPGTVKRFITDGAGGWSNGSGIVIATGW
ncbi:VCBS repeat-containing protein [Actinokineospora diospyrosa]